MPRKRANDDATPGHDSFLDVVANMVGILIILVMVVGVRVKNSPVAAAITDKATEAELLRWKEARSEEEEVHSRIRAIVAQKDEIERETAVRNSDREQLATTVSAWRHKLDSRRREIDETSRRTFDLTQDLSEAQRRLGQTEQRRLHAEAEKKAPVVVKSYPTPLSKMVEDEEIHFQVRNGRIAHVPVEALAERMKESAQRQIGKLLSQAEFTDTVGPVGGFRMRFTIERRESPREVQMQTGRSGMYARLRRWTLAPTSAQLGETVEEALAERSRFRAILSGFKPSEATVTLWTYEDGFEAFRELKKELYLMGFDTAARPLSDGMPISGSPEGSRSAAQ